MIGLPIIGGYELWRLRLFSFGGYGLALAALAPSNASPQEVLEVNLTP